MIVPIPRLLLALLAALLLLSPAGAEAKSHAGKPHAAKKHRKHAAKKRPHAAKKHRLRPTGDRDHDGLTNAFERRAKTNPRKTDTDRDGLPDALEDGDADGLNNRGEQMTGMDPRNPDTDDDGILDGDENAGVVTSVADGLVTIALAKGGTLVAGLDATTDVLCSGAAGDDGDDDSASDDDPGDDGDDDGGDDDDDTRSVLLAGGCAPAVGDVVYEADVDPDGGPLLTLDLLGA